MILGFLVETRLNFIKRTFEDVYGPGSNPTNYTGQEFTERLTPTASDVYVYNCVFRYCSSSSNGGALYFSNSVYKLLIEQSSFISCRTDQKGGGICSYSRQCVLSRICGFNCSSTNSSSNYGQFTYIS